MITSRRDYLLRIIDEVGRLLAMAVFKRGAGADEQALETIVAGLQRLFVLDADQIFLLTPEQHYALLVDEDESDFARDKVLLYAALNVEAGAVYAKQNKTALARATRLTALRFTLRARKQFGAEGLPSYAPDVGELLKLLAGQPLDPETEALISAST